MLQPTNFTNLSASTLTGGSYEVDAGSILELNNNATIVTDNATIILSGVGSAIQGFNTTTSKEVAIDSTLTTIGAAGTLEILGGRNWTSVQAMSNAGTLQLGGGTFAPASLTNIGTVSGFGAIATTITNNGTMSAQAGQTLTLQEGSLTNLSGTTLTGGTYIVGAGATLQLANNTSIATLNATVDLAGVGATLQSLNTGTSTQVSLESTLTTIGASGALQVLGGRSYTTANAIGNSGILQLGGGTFTSGTLTDAAGSSLTGFGTIASAFTDSGAVTSSGGALAFTGTGDVFNAALAGTEIDFSGGTDLLQSGSSLTASTVAILGGATVTVGANVAASGILSQAAGTTLIINTGDAFSLTGAGSTLAGAINGAGTLVFAGGTQAVNAGAAIGVASWSLTGGTATINENLTYAGAFSESAGATLAVATGDKLSLTGSASLAGTVNGAGTVKLSSATVGALTVGGTATLNDVGAVHQNGALTLGDAAGNAAATLLINAGAVYAIDNDSGIARGHSKKSNIKNSGLFIKSGGTGVSVIGVNVADTGAIEAASGTLDFTQRLTGSGTMSVDGGATLEVDLSAASTLGMTFNGAGAVLALGNASKFAATINGFASTDTIDLLGTKATSATLGAGDTLAVMNGIKLVATLQLAGDFTGDTFNVASDGNGGTNVTVTPGPGPALAAVADHAAPAHVAAPAPSAGHQFVAAMAGFGGEAGGPVSIGFEGHAPAHHAALCAPRLMHAA